MQLIMIRALLAVCQTMITDKHCFELYGTRFRPCCFVKIWSCSGCAVYV
jgi:hypothetical protein